MSTNSNVSWEEETVRRSEQKFDRVYEGFCQLITTIKESQDVYCNLNKIPVAKMSGDHISKEKDLERKKMEIHDLKIQMAELQNEIEAMKNNKSMKERAAAAKCCKLITGFEIAESDQQYVGVSVKNPSVYFACDAKDPQVTSKLWNKVERL